MTDNKSYQHQPSLVASVMPVVVLVFGLVAVVVTQGADAVQSLSCPILLSAAFLSIFITVFFYRRKRLAFVVGMLKSAKQVLPTIPILLLIGAVSSTWILSGVVPILIYYGLQMLSPDLFLFVACFMCSAISLLSGSSWTTVATIGVAFMGIGTVMGYGEGWIAGAIISGAYFGDKVSPLSDTTVLAASTCNVNLFTHIRYMMLTTAPALIVALSIYAIVGLALPMSEVSDMSEILNCLGATFNLSPLVLTIPLLTCVLLAFRFNTLSTLAMSALAGLCGMFLFQPQIVSILSGADGSSLGSIVTALQVLMGSTAIETHHDLLNALVVTRGMAGMLPTIYLVLSAMIFGGAMMGSGMLSTITHSFNRHLRSMRNIVATTVASGLMLNACTGDQYLSIILDGNIYRNLYRRNGLESRLLSRTVEDSVSVTSVLIPWNSCGMTQSTVLGVATIVYMPYCFFNILCPIMALIMAWTGYRIYCRQSTKNR